MCREGRSCDVVGVMRPAGVMIYYVRMKTRTRPLRLFRFATRPPRGSRQITLSLNTLSLVPDPLGDSSIANALLQSFLKRLAAAEISCAACNGKFDKPGGPHGH